MDLNHCLRMDNKRIVEEIERELGYLLESKAELESHIRIGQNAKIELKETEKELQKRMATWLSIKEAI